MRASRRRMARLRRTAARRRPRSRRSRARPTAASRSPCSGWVEMEQVRKRGRVCGRFGSQRRRWGRSGGYGCCTRRSSAS